jgi:hypothetical protein
VRNEVEKKLNNALIVRDLKDAKALLGELGDEGDFGFATHRHTQAPPGGASAQLRIP